MLRFTVSCSLFFFISSFRKLGSLLPMLQAIFSEPQLAVAEKFLFPGA